MLDPIEKIDHDKATQLAEFVNQMNKELTNSVPKDTTTADNIAEYLSEYLSDFGENNAAYLVMALIRRLHCAGDKGQVYLAMLEDSLYVRTCGIRKPKEDKGVSPD